MNTFQAKSLTRIVESADKLSQWERGFVESIMAKPSDYELSEKQNQTLNSLNSKVLGFGL